MKNTIVILSILLCTTVFGQKIPASFYEHYTGLISEELKITADLIKLENSFSGFYYYEFQEEGHWISSNPIALDGRVNEDGSFVLNEFGGQTSFFSGNLENTKLIKGVWENENLKENVDFTLKATYAKGTINLNVVEQLTQTYFQQDPNLPKAELSLALLFPDYSIDQAVYHQLLSRIYYYIGFRGAQDEANIIQQLQEKYDQQFQNALANIELDSFPDSFNWNKSIRMDVINNESGLLCLQFDTYAKSGNREGSKVRKYLVFDIENNKVLKLKDIVSETTLVQLNQLIEQELRENYRLDADQPLTNFGFFNDEIQASQNFYIHPGGLGFYYNVYEIAPPANGPTNLFLPWKDLKSKNIEIQMTGIENH